MAVNEEILDSWVREINRLICSYMELDLYTNETQKKFSNFDSNRMLCFILCVVHFFLDFRFVFIERTFSNEIHFRVFASSSHISCISSFWRTINLFISSSIVLSCAFHFKCYIWPSECVSWWNVTNVNAHCSWNTTSPKNEPIDCWTFLLSQIKNSLDTKANQF